MREGSLTTVFVRQRPEVLHVRHLRVPLQWPSVFQWPVHPPLVHAPLLPPPLPDCQRENCRRRGSEEERRRGIFEAMATRASRGEEGRE